MRIEEFDIDFSICQIDDKIDDFEEDVIYHHSKEDTFYAKCKSYEWDNINNKYLSDFKFVMCWIPEEIVELAKSKHRIAINAFKEIDDLKAQYKENLKYDSMKAQMWCDIAREKDIDSANKALRAFDEIFEAKK